MGPDSRGGLRIRTVGVRRAEPRTGSWMCRNSEKTEILKSLGQIKATVLDEGCDVQAHVSARTQAAMVRSLDTKQATAAFSIAFGIAFVFLVRSLHYIDLKHMQSAAKGSAKPRGEAGRGTGSTAPVHPSAAGPGHIRPRARVLGPQIPRNPRRWILDVRRVETGECRARTL